MAMSEVAYMIHNHAKVMIGAEGFEPLAGWPYQMVLTALNDNEINDDLKKLSTRIVQDYTTFYTDYQAAGVSVDQQLVIFLSQTF